MALTDKLSAIADAIREKAGTTEKLTLDKMPEAIASITGGGKSAADYVNFYDYDGSLLHQYPLSVFGKMAALPMHPNSRKDCECVGWNMDMGTIKAMKSHVNAAAIYNQKDEAPQEHTPGEPVYVDGTKLYLHIPYEMQITIYFRQTAAKGVTVHWGDGESSVSGTGVNATISLNHTFAPGDYGISFEVADGCILSLGYGNTNYSVLGYTNTTSGTYAPVWNTLQKAEIDLRNTALLSAAFRMCLGLKEVRFGGGRSTTVPSYCFDYCQSLERVELSDDITTIYDYAFRCCYRLRNLTIPTSVQSIGSYAFCDCRRLHNILVPGTVKTISSNAFQNCTALRQVQLGSGVQTLGSSLFTGCYHLEKVNLPNTVKTLGSSSFYQCYALKELVFPAHITAIPGSICQNCYGLKTVVLPEGITQISDSAFSGCISLQFVGFPKSVSTIYDSAFSGCCALRNAVFGMNLKDIRASAFLNGYSLESIVLPPSASNMGLQAFTNCKSLKHLVLPPALAFKPGCIVSCELPSAQTGEYYRQLLENAAAIPSYAFSYNRTLESAEIPENIKSIGDYAFQYVYSLRNAMLPYGLQTIDSYGFRYDYLLRDLTLPLTLTSIGQNVFEQCHGLESVVLPGSLRTVNASAFLSCYGLKTLDIRGNSMVLNSSAFSGCYSLKQLYFSPGVTTISIAASAFQSCGFEVIQNLPQKTSFTGGSIFQSCFGLEKAVLDGVYFQDYSVGNNLFYYCHALAEVTLPETLDAICSGMFQCCYALKQITLGRYLTTIYSNGFYDCRNLETVEFTGSALRTIQSQAFYYCWQMKEIRIPHSVTSMAQCFPGCFALHDIYMHPLTAPTGTTSLGSLADGYVIHVPKGHLDSYQKQWTAHAGHFAEFEYMIPESTQMRKTIGLSDTEVCLKNAFIHTDFPEGQTFTLTYQYDGTNLSAIKDIAFDVESGQITFSFDRVEDFDYDKQENIRFCIQADGMQVSCEFSVQLRYLRVERTSEYTVICPSRYGFVSTTDDFYQSANKAVSSSYALARVNLVSATGKVYVDIIGGGESNYDYGIVSKLDCELKASTEGDTGSNVKVNYCGRGSYTETLEYDVEDFEEHFLCFKFRKDGSVDSGMDSMKFRIRFD